MIPGHSHLVKSTWSTSSPDSCPHQFESGKSHLLINSFIVVAPQCNLAVPNLLDRTCPIRPVQSDALHHIHSIDAELSILMYSFEPA